MLDSATRVLRSDDDSNFYSRAAPAKLPPAMIPVFAGSNTNIVAKENSYQFNAHRNIAVHKAVPVSPHSDKLDSLSGTIRYVENDFVTVAAKISGESIEFRISRELCDDQLAKEGMPVKVSIDDSGGYSTLRIERREKSQNFSPELTKRMSVMEEWISGN